MIVGIYTRVSTQEQAKEGYSLGEQEERLKSYCNARGWTVGKVYTDGGFSGGNMDRPALQQMIRDVKNNKVELVLVYKLDRLSRSQKDTLELIEDVFLKHNVDFVSMNENFDTSTPFGRAMIGILSVFAQLEREQIKERLSVGRVGRAKEGYYHGGGRLPIGYDYIDGKLEINEYEAMQVRELYDLFLKGRSINSIRIEFSKKYTNRYGNWRTNNSVHSCLTTPIYYGMISFNGELYKGKHKPLVSKEMFDRVQDRLKELSKQNPNSKTSFKPNYLLTGLVWCAKCGARYGGKVSGNKYDKHRYYRCYSKTKIPNVTKDPNCTSHSRRVEKLDKLVIDEILKLQFDENYLDEIARDVESQDHDINKINTLNNRIEEIKEQLKRITDMYQLGTLSLEDLKERAEILNEEQHNLLIELEKVENEETKIMSKNKTKDILKNANVILESDDMEAKRMLLHSLIEKIIIHDDHVDIHWNF